MYKNKKILALITARGGSKGIPRKNIKLLANIPLICWTIEVANKSKYIDRLILSSDDDEIISIAQESGCDVPFVRPSELASDTTPSMDVILHALSKLESDSFDYLLLLQPTSPFRNNSHIDNMIESFFKEDAKIMVSISKLKKHPYFMYEISHGFLKPICKAHKITRRQDMPSSYQYNGAMYMADIEFLKTVKNFHTDETKGFVMDDLVSLDIDDELDWVYAEFLIREGYI